MSGQQSLTNSLLVTCHLGAWRLHHLFLSLWIVLPEIANLELVEWGHPDWRSFVGIQRCPSFPWRSSIADLPFLHGFVNYFPNYLGCKKNFLWKMVACAWKNLVPASPSFTHLIVPLCFEYVLCCFRREISFPEMMLLKLHSDMARSLNSSIVSSKCRTSLMFVYNCS